MQRSEDGQTTDYGYDALYRLLNATDTQDTESFTYDSVGNRLSGPTTIDTPSNAYDYNNAHQMTQGRKFAYSYDNNGNQLTRSQKNGKTWTQTWDAENRLIEVSRTNGADSSIVTFKYDPFGRRIEKQIVNSFNGDTITKTVNYVYDAEDIVLQIEEVTHDSTTTTTETRFIHGPGIDEPLAFVRDGQSYFYHADGLGSIVAITDSTQAIAQKYSYESFGLPTPQTTLQQPYMFTAREWDAEIGLYFYRARYYDPMEGRFISEDPLNFGGGDYNLFNYVQNSPINFIDPWGLQAGVAVPGVLPIYIPPGSVFEPGSDANKAFTESALDLLELMDPRPLANAIVDLVCSDGDDTQDDTQRCMEVKEKCIQGCSDFVLQKAKKNRGDLGGMDFHRCVKQCMDRNGC